MNVRLTEPVCLYYTTYEGKSQAPSCGFDFHKNPVATAFSLLVKNSSEYTYNDAADGEPVQYEFRDHGEEFDSDCPYHVPRLFKLSKKNASSGKKPRIDPKDKFPVLYREMVAGKITDATIQESLLAHFENAPLLLIDSWDNQERFVPGKIRGDSRDAASARAKIEAYTQQLEQMSGTTFFLTCSLANEPFNGNLYEANLAYVREVLLLKKRIRRMGNASFVAVTEAQARGALHLHIILRINGLYTGHYVDKWGNWKPSDPFIMHRLQKLWKIGNIDIKIARDENLKGYIRKYIAKGFEKSYLESIPTEKKAHAEWRKQCLGVLAPMLAKCRRFYHSSDIKIIPQDTKQNRIDESVNRELKKIAGIKTGELTRRDLVLSLNNLTKICRGHSWTTSEALVKAKFTPALFNNYPKNHPIIADFKAQSRCCGCAGCIVTQLVDNLLQKYGENLEQMPDEPVEPPKKVEITEYTGIPEYVNLYYKRKTQQKDPPNPPKGGIIEKEGSGLSEAGKERARTQGESEHRMSLLARLVW